MTSKVWEAKDDKQDATSKNVYSQNRSSNEISRYDIQYETVETPDCHLSIIDEQYMKQVTIFEEFKEIIALDVEQSKPIYKQDLQETNDTLHKKLWKHKYRNHNKISHPDKVSKLDTISDLSMEIPLQNLHFPTEIIRGEEYYSEQESKKTNSCFKNTDSNMNSDCHTKHLSNDSTDQSQSNFDDVWNSQQTVSGLNSNNSPEILNPEEVEMLLLSHQPEEIDEQIMEEDEDEIEENENFDNQNQEKKEDKRRSTSAKKYTLEEEKILAMLREVVRKCTVTDPSKRPTASEIMQILSG